MRFIVHFFLYLTTFVILVIAVAAILILEPVPVVAERTTPQPEHIDATRELLHRFRAATESGAPASSVSVTPFEMQSVFALGTRTVPGSRAETEVEEGEILVKGSIPLRLYSSGGPWINASASIPDFDQGVEFESLRIGRMDLPPQAAVSVARAVANRWFGEGVGDDMIAAFPEMTATTEGFEVAIAVGEDGRGDMARKLFSVFRGNQMPTAQEVVRYHGMLAEALQNGTLQSDGTFAPHLEYMLSRALEDGQTDDLAREYAAAIFALTTACGSEHIRPYLTKLLPGGGELADQAFGESPCGTASLHGRVDLRRHFVTAASLQAASNRGVAISIGEFKELNDMTGASGFDFTDIVANNSGIRLSDLMMSSPAEDWPQLISMLSEEANFIAPLEGVPVAMDMARFEEEFEGLDSPQYYAMLQRIESRIDDLPVHSAAY